MFNAEKLLGGMLKQSMGFKGMVHGNKAQIGIGLIGVAFAAVEHFMNNAQGQGSSSGNMPANSNAGGSFTPPPPPPGKMASPPFSNASPSAPPPPPPAYNTVQSTTGEEDAVLLIRAMIASAAADGYIDANERQNIINRLKSVDLSDEELEFIKEELASPCSIEEIVSQVNTPEMAKEVYTVSLMAIEMDTEEEKRYLDNLAERLGLDQSVRNQIHNKLDVKE